MSGWEYKVVPAPKKGAKGSGVKGAEGRFANAIESLMNDMGSQGWEYQRAETLPSTERSGLTGSTTEWRNLLVFRRTVVDPIDAFEPELLPAPVTLRPIAMPSVAVVAAHGGAPAATEAEPAGTQDGAQHTDRQTDAPEVPEIEAQADADAAFTDGLEERHDMENVTRPPEAFTSKRNDANSHD